MNDTSAKVQTLVDSRFDALTDAQRFAATCQMMDFGRSLAVAALGDKGNDPVALLRFRYGADVDPVTLAQLERAFARPHA